MAHRENRKGPGVPQGGDRSDKDLKVGRDKQGQAEALTRTVFLPPKEGVHGTHAGTTEHERHYTFSI